MTDNKLAVFGSESVTKCHQLKLEAVDGKKMPPLNSMLGLKMMIKLFISDTF
jgi:hypothetical protein